MIKLCLLLGTCIAGAPTPTPAPRPACTQCHKQPHDTIDEHKITNPALPEGWE